MEIRTDLALEADLSQMSKSSGIRFEQRAHKTQKIFISKLEILTLEVAKSFGKSPGTYYTIEAEELQGASEDYHKEVSSVLSGYLKELLIKCCPKKLSKVLIVGLGNPSSTADALGPLVADNIRITLPDMESEGISVSALVPRVKAQTGMETADIIKGVIKTLKPDALIVVDSLAARDPARLACTIQLSDAGIMPGSGVGNHRKALNRDILGIPVIALGIPMVVEAYAIALDICVKTMEEYFGKNSEFAKSFTEMTSSEKKDYITSLMPLNMAEMYVTPKDVDEAVKRLSYTISEAVNSALADL